MKEVRSAFVKVLVFSFLSLRSHEAVQGRMMTGIYPDKRSGGGLIYNHKQNESGGGGAKRSYNKKNEEEWVTTLRGFSLAVVDPIGLDVRTLLLQIGVYRNPYL